MGVGRENATSYTLPTPGDAQPEPHWGVYVNGRLQVRFAGPTSALHPPPSLHSPPHNLAPFSTPCPCTSFMTPRNEGGLPVVIQRAGTRWATQSLPSIFPLLPPTHRMDVSASPQALGTDLVRHLVGSVRVLDFWRVPGEG